MAEIALVDCNNFYASCEQLMDPSLKGKPICVTSNNNGCVVARSKEAKALGVKMGMPVFMAKKEFPTVIYLEGRLGLYGEISQRIMSSLLNFTPMIEVYSIDEAFIDLSGLRRLYRKSYFKIAQDIQKHINDEIGIPVSIGIASTKVLAKVATERAKKGEGVYQIGRLRITGILKETDLSQIWGIGKNTSALLNKYGIRTAYQLTELDNLWVKKVLGKKGLELKEELLGRCISPIDNTFNLPKSIQKTSSFAKSTRDIGYIKNSLHYHTHRGCTKLRRLKMKANVIGIMLRTKDFRVITEKTVLVSPTNCEFEVHKKIDNLLSSIYKPEIFYRSSGVFFESLIEEKGEQLSLFAQVETKQHKISALCDALEDKYGKESIKIGFY